MNKTAALAFMLFLTSLAASQNVPNGQPDAQCKFSDGKRITVTPERRSYRLATNGSLITVGGRVVPPGDYSIIQGLEPYGHFLLLRKSNETGESSQRLRIPLSASTVSMPESKDDVSFVSTGGSCKMQLALDKSRTLFSLEFTEKNTDLPLVP